MDFKIFVGVDISKLTLDIVIVISKKQSILHRQVSNDNEGYMQIISLIKNKGELEDVLFCMEHTGVYGIPFASYLEENQLSFSLQSPLHIKQSMGLRRGKSDKADAEMLAKFAYLYKDEIKISGVPSKVIQQLKNLLVYRERLVKAKVSLENSSGELASFTSKETHIAIVKGSNKYIDQFKASIEQLEEEIKETIKNAPDIKKVFDLATSVPGVGILTASYLIVHTRCFTLFSDYRKMACYCGIAPFEYTSGTSIKGKTRVSKIGNMKLKSLLGLGALSALNVDEDLKNYYDRRIKEGKPKASVMNILTVIMH